MYYYLQEVKKEGIVMSESSLGDSLLNVQNSKKVLCAGDRIKARCTVEVDGQTYEFELPFRVAAVHTNSTHTLLLSHVGCDVNFEGSKQKFDQFIFK